MRTAAAGSAAALFFIVVASLVAQDQRPVFKAETSSVTVSVAVKMGNAPVAGLKAVDFRLYDNNVPQRIDAVSVEAVPVDITLFMDTSGSTAAALGDMKRAVQLIASMLRSGDRFRVITIGLSVYTSVPWREAGQPFTLEMEPVAGISLIYDAVLASLVHQVPTGRRHLIVALTDGQDCGSIATPAMVRDVSARSEAVLHWVSMAGLAMVPADGAGAFCSLGADRDARTLETAAGRTGGDVHRGLFGNAGPVQAFSKIFDDFRRSYVLHYSPEGVPREGWHQLRVEVPAGKYTVNARSGYFGGEK
jgi:VWFA-related protein